MRLLTIPFSHFSEKARWALDYAGLPYTEEPALPGLHLLATKRVGGRSVPVLVTDDGVFRDSTDILAYVDRRAPAERKIWPLDPAERARAQALEDTFDRGLGKASRVLAYFHLLPEPAKLVKAVGQKLRPLERVALRAALPALSRSIRKSYRVDEANAKRSLDVVHEAFDLADEALAGGRRYLVSDRLSGADIAFAALAAPILAPPGHPALSSSLTDLPLALQTEIKKLRARAAGQHALRLYAEER